MASLAAVEPQQGRLSLSLTDMLVTPGNEEDDTLFQAKKSFQPYHSQSVPKSQNLEAHRSDHSGTPVTTVMLRNIPNKYTQNTLMQEINDLGFCGTYNFFYLPMDVHNRSNVGYAFINFEKPKDTERFRRSFSEHRFQRFHSRKIGSVCTAHVQGLDENLRHFENRAVTQARNDQYRPVVLKGQHRVEFEEAVAEVKARSSMRGEALANQTGKQHHAPAKIPAKVEDAEAAKGVHVAREGLEAAIFDYLVNTKQSDQPGSGAAKAVVAQPPGLEQVETQDMYAAAAYQGADTDIAQLLSLRSLLVGRLLEKKEAAEYNAFSNFSLPPGFGNDNSKAMNFYSQELEANSLTPRTNNLSLWTTFDGYTQDDMWQAL
mmetsp:Transcript_41924/g.66585  ORF Transcript_41924/g.66585 Transcript_41924/m.66585 type:complete len:374 (-) Transcript_41924:126-1247(-)|eukprot:CAMPEP_0169131872 /NCGR_PEP_ID=MMETSP1015-20121227/38488_1 /TAXON_ID=342587 /ORGANISM="Karlodinium micrum, Strain CCMP2283" /LENGTH=373 /DNA_ID=CAMNT_0009196181 /DNA_START=72 /DNA_END=1193 /DNA_ORIENTATION=-